MSPITADDIEAARLLIGNKVSHPEMDRFDTTRCDHRLAGSGRPVESFDQSSRDAVTWLWDEQPYRHHLFTLRPENRNIGKEPMCHCGNPEANEVHLICWKEN